MSPANVYRFFASRRALEEAVVAELLEEVFMAATQAARSGGWAFQRLAATLRTISQLHEYRLARDSKLHELIAAAARGNRPVALCYAGRIRGLVQPIVAAGQTSGELLAGNPIALTCCLLEAMDAYLSPSRIRAATLRPTFSEMMDFCAGARRERPSWHSVCRPTCVSGPWARDSGRRVRGPFRASSLPRKPQERN